MEIINASNPAVRVHSNRIDYIKVLIYSTILLAVCDLYLFGANLPVKIYYLPIFFFPFIYYLQHPVLSVKLKKRHILLLLFYIILIAISFFRSPYRSLFGISSPAIFVIGVVVDVLTFSFFYLLFDTGRHYSILKKAVFWSVIINAIICCFFFVSDNVFRLNLGHNLAVQGTNYIRASGLYAEPDILGFYVSSMALLVFPLLKRSQMFKVNIYNSCFWLNTIINVVSVTRTTIISQILCILFYLSSKRKIGKLLPWLVCIGAIIIIGTVFHENSILGRVGINSANSDLGAVNTRIYSIMLNVEEIKKSFLFGSGPGYLYDLVQQEDMLTKFAQGTMINTNRNGTVFFLGEIFNTGALGLAIVIALLFFVWRGLTITNKNKLSPFPGEQSQFVDGIKLLFLNALIVSFSNTVIKMVFIWVFVGIGCKIANQIRREIADAK